MVFLVITNRLGGYFGLRKKYFEAKSLLLKKIYLLIHKGFQYETNSSLPFESKIEGPINFMHGTYGVFISGMAKIGKNCTIFQQVTIGSNMLIDSKNLGSPIIGDNCIIGAGAKIIGNIKIGNNCRIGANAVVTKNLASDCIIVSSNQLVLSKNNSNNKIYQYSISGWGYQQDGKFVKEEDIEIVTKLEAIEF